MSAVLKIVEPVQEPDVVNFSHASWCQLTKVGLKLCRPNVRTRYEEWESLKSQLTVMGKGIQFALGDWLALGEAQHGEKCAQAVDAHDKTGIKVKTLMEYRRVSQKVPYSIRMESLDWSHHQIVADRPKPERKKWLQVAAENDWSPSELRGAIRQVISPAVNQESEANYLDSNYKTFLLDYVASLYSFLNRCTYDPFKKEIEKAIRRAKFQIGRTRDGDRKAVITQVDEGCCTVEEIEEEIPLSAAEIKKFFIEMVGSEPCLRKPGTSYYSEKPPVGDYEWRPISLQTEMARGGAVIWDLPQRRTFGRRFRDAPRHSLRTYD